MRKGQEGEGSRRTETEEKGGERIEKEREGERTQEEETRTEREKQRRGKRRKRPRTNTDSNDSASSGGDNATISSAQLLANEGEESDGSDTVCMICNAREPPVSEEIVFWVDCDSCGEWAHTYCAHGNNMASRAFICDACSS